MLSTYKDLFRAPGAAAFSATGFLGRMPMSMLGIGTILLVSGTTGAYGVAGLLAGAVTFAGAVAMPQIARLVDRLGQARVVRPVLLVHGLSLAGMIAAVRLDWPVWSWFAFGLLAGASLPSIGSMVRTRWARVLPETDRRQTAFAFESVLDEVVFVIGPPLATVLATAVSPEAGLVAVIAFALVGGWLFTAQRSTEPPPSTSDLQVPRREVANAGVLAVCATYLGTGAVFGSIEIVVVAFSEEQGRLAASGLILACYAAGSLIAGLLYGARRWRRPLSDRFVLAAVVFGVVTLLPLFAPNLAVLAVLIFATGLSIAPVLIAGMSVVERIVPRSALTEGLTLTTTALVIGVTAGAAIAGPLIDAYGARTAFRLPAVAAVLTAVVALVAWPVLRRAREVPDPLPRHDEPDPVGIARCEPASPVPGRDPRDGSAVPQMHPSGRERAG